MGVISDAVVSKGDIARRLDAIEAQLTQLRTARRLEAASIGRGGLRVKGGRLTVQDTAGDDMLRAGGDPAEFFLRLDLLEPLSVAVLANRITTASVAGVASTTATSYGDPTSGDAGPVVTGVSVLTGAALVLLDGFVRAEQVQSGTNEAFMAFTVAGETTIAASDGRSRRAYTRLSLGGSTSVIADGGQAATTAVWVTGLNPGLHTFRAVYRADGIPSGGNNNFAERDLTVIAF